METFNDIIESMENAVNSVLMKEGVFDTPTAGKQWEELKPNTIIIIKGRNIDNNAGFIKDTFSGVDTAKQKHKGLELFATSLSETMVGKDEHGNVLNRIMMATKDSEKYIYFVYKNQDGNRVVAHRDIELGVYPESPMVLVVNLIFIPARINDFNELSIALHDMLESIDNGRQERTPELNKEIDNIQSKIYNIKANAKTIKRLLNYNPLAAPGKRGKITFDRLKQEIVDSVRDTAEGLLSDYPNDVRYIKAVLQRLTKIDNSSVVRIRPQGEPAHLKPGPNLSISDIKEIKTQALNKFKEALSFSTEQDYKTTRISIYIKVPQ